MKVFDKNQKSKEVFVNFHDSEEYVYLCDKEGNKIEGCYLLSKTSGLRYEYVNKEYARKAGIVLDDNRGWEERDCIKQMVKYIEENL